MEENRYLCHRYPAKVLANLNELRKNTKFCDVDIIAEQKTVKAHRAILAASSPYFNAMFTGGLSEQRQNTVKLHSVSDNMLDIIIHFIYTGEVKLCEQIVQELIIVADMLELQDLVAICTKYLKNELHPSNAVGIYRFAQSHNCKELAGAALGFIHTNFPQVCKEDEICDLSKEEICTLLGSEQLKVESEFQVLQAAVRWITHDARTRRQYVFEVLRLVRLSLVSLSLVEREIAACADNSLKIALRSVHEDLALRRGSLVALIANPRLRAKKNIFLVGGSKVEGTGCNRVQCNYTTVERYDLFRREWSKAAPTSVSRIIPRAAALNGRVYVAGGEQDSRVLASCEAYEPNEDVWRPVAGMAVPRCEFALCALGGRLFAMGGWVGDDICDSIEIYEPVADEWTHEGKMPEPRFSMGVAAYEGLVYVVGGCSRLQRHLQDLMSYDPATKRWKVLQPMGVARSQIGVAVLDGHLYVVGGFGRDREVLSSVERYCFASGRWGAVPSMQAARAVPAVTAADGRLYVIGGNQIQETFYRAQVTLASVECYDPVSNVWRECPSLPESRGEAAAVVL